MKFIKNKISVLLLVTVLSSPLLHAVSARQKLDNFATAITNLKQPTIFNDIQALIYYLQILPSASLNSGTVTTATVLTDLTNLQTDLDTTTNWNPLNLIGHVSSLLGHLSTAPTSSTVTIPALLSHLLTLRADITQTEFVLATFQTLLTAINAVVTDLQTATLNGTTVPNATLLPILTAIHDDIPSAAPGTATTMPLFTDIQPLLQGLYALGGVALTAGDTTNATLRGHLNTVMTDINLQPSVFLPLATQITSLSTQFARIRARLQY